MSTVLAAISIVAALAHPVSAPEHAVQEGAASTPRPEAADFPLDDVLARASVLDADGREHYNAGSSFAFDNDLFVIGGDDTDYTGGGVATFAGRRAVELPVSLDRVLGPLDRLVPYTKDGRRRPALTLHALQFGVIAFTPDDLNESGPIYDDRPYASLLALANVRTFVVDSNEPVYETSVAVGILGLDVAKAIQRTVHESLDLNEIPEGWGHQISDGGEPTFRLGWGRQALLAHGSNGKRAHDLKWRVDANVGYITEAGFSLSARWGRFRTPWWTSSPDRNAYLSQPSPVVGGSAPDGPRELYFWGGIKGRVRAYNVFLQGQFRDSEVEFSSREVEHGIVEAWLGLTWEVTRAVRLSYVARYQSAELKLGLGNRSMRWAGFVVTRALGDDETR